MSDERNRIVTARMGPLRPTRRIIEFVELVRALGVRVVGRHAGGKPRKGEHAEFLAFVNGRPVTKELRAIARGRFKDRVGRKTIKRWLDEAAKENGT